MERYKVYIPYDIGNVEGNVRKIRYLDSWIFDKFGEYNTDNPLWDYEIRGFGREYSFLNKDDAVLFKLICGGNV
jgi:hypothetical protein